jgi:hypothetical protein
LLASFSLGSDQGSGLDPLEVPVCDGDGLGDASRCLRETIGFESISKTGQGSGEKDDHEIAEIRAVLSAIFVRHWIHLLIPARVEEHAGG